VYVDVCSQRVLVTQTIGTQKRITGNSGFN
jgi:hypothetical protein